MFPNSAPNNRPALRLERTVRDHCILNISLIIPCCSAKSACWLVAARVGYRLVSKEDEIARFFNGFEESWHDTDRDDFESVRDITEQFNSCVAKYLKFHKVHPKGRFAPLPLLANIDAIPPQLARGATFGVEHTVRRTGRPEPTVPVPTPSSSSSCWAGS